MSEVGWEGKLDGGVPMSYVEYKKGECPLANILDHACLRSVFMIADVKY